MMIDAQNISLKSMQPQFSLCLQYFLAAIAALYMTMLLVGRMVGPSVCVNKFQSWFKYFGLYVENTMHRI